MLTIIFTPNPMDNQRDIDEKEKLFRERLREADARVRTIITRPLLRIKPDDDGHKYFDVIEKEDPEDQEINSL